MKETHYIDQIEALKAISDSFRVQILLNLGVTPQSGQQLAEKMKVSRSKVHYHLKALEKHGFIEVVREEVINGIVQKFYLPVAIAFIPDMHLFGEMFQNSFQQVFVKKEKLSDFQKEFIQLIEKYDVKEKGEDIEEVKMMMSYH